MSADAVIELTKMFHLPKFTIWSLFMLDILSLSNNIWGYLHQNIQQNIYIVQITFDIIWTNCRKNSLINADFLQ